MVKGRLEEKLNQILLKMKRKKHNKRLNLSEILQKAHRLCINLSFENKQLYSIIPLIFILFPCKIGLIE